MNIQVLLRHTSLQLRWHFYHDMLQVFVCSTSSCPWVCPHSASIVRTRPIATEANSRTEVWSYTLMNIINEQQVLRVKSYSNSDLVVCCIGTSTDQFQHISGCMGKKDKVVFSQLTASHTSLSIGDLKPHL